MIIRIKTLTGREREIETDSKDTVEMLKQKIEKIEAIPYTQQRLIFSGRIMTDDGKKLGDYNINANSVIHMVLALRGG